MVLQIRSSRFGHVATFYPNHPLAQDHPCEQLEYLVEWGPAEIAVPSDSVLDCPAIVQLNRIEASERSARNWCNRVGATYHHLQDGVLTFQVQHFSRYRFVDSDDEDEDEDNDAVEIQASASAATPTPTPAAAANATPAAEKNPPSSAGRTPFRRPRPLLLPGQPKVENLDDASPGFRSGRAGVTAPIDDDSDLDAEEIDQDGTAASAPNGNGTATPAATATAQALQLVPRTRGGVAPAVRAAQFWANLAPSPSATRMRDALFTDYGKQSHSQAQAEDEDNLNVDAPVPDEDRMVDVTPAKRRAARQRVRFIDAESENKQTPKRSGQVVDTEMADVATPTPKAPEAETQEDPLRERVPFPLCKHSVTHGHEGTFTDPSLMLARSFRLAFSHDGRYVQPGYSSLQGEKSHVADVVPVFGEGVRNERDHVYFLLLHINVWKNREMNTPTHMETQTQTSRDVDTFGDAGLEDDVDAGADRALSKRSNRRIKVPSLEPGFSTPDVQDDYLIEFCNGLSESKEDLNAQHALVLFNLVHALYKSSEGSGVTGAENLLSRLADWGRGPAGTWFDAETPAEPSLRRALCLMSVGDVQGAAETAIAVGHVRLALLIARALESPKDELRSDAQDQLAEYRLEGVEIKQRDDGMNDLSDEPTQLGSILDNCNGDDLITVDERMLLLLLAGQVAPVARYLKVSWYRVFIMELIFGGGCTEAPLAQRVQAAINGVDESKISVLAPHGQSEDLDVAYHLLKLFSHPTGSYPITSGIYSPRGYMKGNVLDAKFSWCLHQVLTSVVGPRCTDENVAWHLAEAYALQLFAMGLPLWGFYVLCSGCPHEPALRDILLRKWPEISADFSEWNVDGESTVTQHSDDGHVEERRLAPVNSMMSAEVFLVSVLGVPVEWIHEAKATQYRYQGDALKECAELVRVKSNDEATNRAHDVLVNNVFPKSLAAHDNEKLELVKSNLAQLAHRGISGWAERGQLVLDYLRYLAPGADAKKVDVNLCRSMAEKLPALHRAASTPLQMHAAQTIADAVIAAYRALAIVATQQDDTHAALLNALEAVPCSDEVSRRTAAELTLAHTGHAAIVNRYAAAHPIYAPFIANVLDE